MTRDPHYEDGPRLIGGAELPRLADTREARAICGELPTRSMSLTKALDACCVLAQHHKGQMHKNRGGDEFPSPPRDRREAFWREMKAARAAAGAGPVARIEGWSFSVTPPGPEWCLWCGAKHPAGTPCEPRNSADDFVDANKIDPDDASWETQDRVWADEAVAERDATSERRAGRVLRG